jgi:hypothetical protein
MLMAQQPARGHAFTRLVNERTPEQRSASAAARFEHARIKWVVGALKLGAYQSDLRNKMNEIYGTRSHLLTCVVFNETFPTFPWLLRTAQLEVPIDRDPDSVEPQRFRAFRGVPFVREFLDVKDSAKSLQLTQPLVLVVPRKGMLQGMAIHDDDTETGWPHGLSWVYKAENGKKIFVQMFSDMVKALHAGGRGWRPE